MQRDELTVATITLPTGAKGYCLCNKEQTLRYSCYSMFHTDMKTCTIYEKPFLMESQRR